jgi:phosphosulfolactate phosphohydrolase-like enzyme
MPPAAVAGGVAVVIDVIRASTTITTAVANGAASVFPVESVERALERASSLGEGTLLGGERGGIRIEGFDLGNSPREYTPERVAGHQIVFTTTNGTAALAACHEAAVVMIGCLVNRSAVAVAARAAAVEHQTAVHLVCAGVERQLAEEDLLGAGAILDAAADRFPHDAFDDDDRSTAEAIAAQPHDVIFLSGVGEVYPFIRSHNVLNNLQSTAKDKPTVLFFPGSYTHSTATGGSLDLFGLLHDDKYYRAFNILNYEV